MEPFEDSVHPGFSGRAQRVEVRPPGHAGSRAGGEGLDDVAPAPDPTVADDFGPAAHGIGHGRDERERGRGAVELSATVIGQCDGLDAGLGGEYRVGDGLDALQDDRAIPHRAQPRDVVPREGGIELGVDVVGQVHRRGAVTDVVAHNVGEADRIAAHERPRPLRVPRAVDHGPWTDRGWE